MDWYGCSVSTTGKLTLGGFEVTALAEKYGTPLYIMDGNLFRNICRTYRNALNSLFIGGGEVAFASKAFCTSYIYKVLRDEGLCADVVSGGEIFTALNGNFPTEKLIFHGNNKTKDELEFAVKNSVGRFVIDSREELELLDSVLERQNKTANIMFRIKPGIDAHVHEFVKTGVIDSKFGFTVENGEAIEIVRRALSFKRLKILGAHCHIGSQILETAPFELAAQRMCEFVYSVKNKLGYEMTEINFGGGFGVKYTGDDAPPAISEYLGALASTVSANSEKYGIRTPKIIIEPGRSIAAPAGITVYRVGSVKEIPNVRTYVSVDGGITDNPRYILYKSKYEILDPDNACGEKNMLCTIAGRNCESGDLIAENIKIQPVKQGNFLAVLGTGAYNYSMSSNYNRVPRPPVVWVENGTDRVIVRRESYGHLVKNDII